MKNNFHINDPLIDRSLGPFASKFVVGDVWGFRPLAVDIKSCLSFEMAKKWSVKITMLWRLDLLPSTHENWVGGGGA
jgi:hypothetical protein